MDKIKAYGICLYKYEQNSIKLLLCKSVNSKRKWGFLKGVLKDSESPTHCAIREFKEESSILVDKDNLEDFYIQKNEVKDIGVYLVNYSNVKNVDKYFNNYKLCKKYLSCENSDVMFFDIDSLPLIKTKQKYLIKDVIKLITSLK